MNIKKLFKIIRWTESKQFQTMSHWCFVIEKYLQAISLFFASDKNAKGNCCKAMDGVGNLLTTWLMLTLRKMKPMSLMFQKNQRNLLNSFASLEEPELGTTNYELPLTCMHFPTMFQFSSKITKHSSNSLARVLRKTMMTQKYFFQKSNKWDAARDVLQLEARQQVFHQCERGKRKYEKQNN